LQQTNTHTHTQTHPDYYQQQQQFTKKHSKEIPNKPTTSIEQKFNNPFFSLPHPLSISTLPKKTTQLLQIVILLPTLGSITYPSSLSLSLPYPPMTTSFLMLFAVL
jgi:hypothetical protein